MTRPDHANPRLTAALRYAAAGWPVFPCIPGEKVPVTRHGFLDATTDPDKITWWWSRGPDRNVAIATGAPGPDVLDVDVHAHGSGFAAFNRLRREQLLDGASAYIRTPSGGLHAYFAGSEQGNGRLPRHHLDFRAKGGYVVAPPSAVNGKPYELIKRTEGRGGLDWAAVTRLLEPEPTRRTPRPADRPADPYRLAEWIARQQEGNRNDALFWAANRALDAGLTDLGDLAEAARSAGLDEREIARTLASARRTGRPFAAEPAENGSGPCRDGHPVSELRQDGPGRLAAASFTGSLPGPGRTRDWNRHVLERASRATSDRAGIAAVGEEKEAEAT